MQALLSELEEWATLNRRDALRDSFRFWILKLPAVLSSVSSGILAIAHIEMIAAILAATASACVLIDAVHPGGQLRNAHLRAVHDLRNLQQKIVNEWRVGSLRGRGANDLAAQILESSEGKREKIAAEIRSAETSFARSVSRK